MTLVDDERRERALTDFDSLLLVEAAAGTGKTSLIAGRVAMMLAAGHAPSGIAAITFTELAASELAQRIRATVDALLRGELPPVLAVALPNGLSAFQRESLSQAKRSLDDLSATTIHGFCQSILRSHGIAAGLDPGARVVDAPVAEGMFADELAVWFTRRLSAAGDPSDPVAVLTRHDPLNVVERVGELARLRRDHSRATPPLPIPGARPDIDFVQAVDDFARAYAAGAGDPWTGTIAAGLQTLSAFYTGALAEARDFTALWRLANPDRSPLMRRKGLDLVTYRQAAETQGAFEDEALNPDAERLYSVAEGAYRTLLGHIAQALTAAMSFSLDAMLEGYAERKRAAAVLDFDDLLVHAHDLVSNHEPLRQALGQRYRYLLVDEFQDTDRRQSEILFLIAADARRPARWPEARLRPGSLFLVGDPKQAIYRFRGADIEAYQLASKVVAAQAQGAILKVSANFRSQKGILDYVNARFEPVLNQTLQPGYVFLTPGIAGVDHGLPFVSRTTIRLDDKPSAEGLREAEAERVAQICERLIGNLVLTRADGRRSPASPADIALLSPAHRDLWRYERALEARHIAVASQAGQALFRRQETQDLLTLLRVLADPLDTLAFGALMRGPLVGLREQDLLDITASLPAGEAARPVVFSVLTPPERIDHAVAKSVVVTLQRLRQRVSSTTPSELLAEAVERMQLRVIIAARHANRNARALANIDAVIERARRYGVAGLQALVQDMQADWERKARVAEGRIDAADDCVEIVTMHNAKGLEWPIVIPINSSTEFRKPDEFVHRQSDNTLHWMLGGIAPPELAAARAEENQREGHQRERLWYVACTRARDMLIIPSIPDSAVQSWSRVLDLAQTDLPELDLVGLPTRTPTAVAAGVNLQGAEEFAHESAVIAAGSAPLVWRRPSDHDPDRLATAMNAVVIGDRVSPVTEAPGAGRTRGSILHKLMEELITGELPPDEAAAASRAAVLLAQLSANATAVGTILPAPTEMAATALRTMRLPEVAAAAGAMVPEVAVWAMAGDKCLAGRADALVLEGTTISTVFDWKSDVGPTEEVRAAYLGQLGAYAAAVGARRGALIYMSLGEVDWFEC